MRKCRLCVSDVKELVIACLTLVGHLLCQCSVNQARFIQLQGMHQEPSVVKEKVGRLPVDVILSIHCFYIGWASGL